MNYYYNKKIKFSHTFNMMVERKTRREILKWITENCGSYNKNYIYWGLKALEIDISGFVIYFKSKEDAMAFKLVWM